MKGNSSFNFLQCSCPMLKSSTIPSDEFLLWEHYQLRANLMEVSAKHCKNHSYCTLKFNILSLSAPLHLWSAFCRKLMRLSVCETRGEFTTAADRCTLRYKYQYIKRKHSHPAGWYSTKQGNSPVDMDKSKQKLVLHRPPRVICSWTELKERLFPTEHWLSVVLVPLLNWKQSVLSGMQNAGRKQEKVFLAMNSRLCTCTGWTEVAQDPV